MKKLILLTSLLSFNALAQNSSLDNLINVNNKNYCYSIYNLDLKNIISYFSMNEETVPTLVSFVSKGVSLNYPVVKVKKLGKDVAKELIKESPKVYTEQDITANPIPNNYTIINDIDLRFDESAGVLANRINSHFNGLNFNSDGLGGSYTFSLKEPLKLKEARNIKDYNSEYSKLVEATFSFRISPISSGEFKGGSTFSYQCVVNMVTHLTTQDIATRLNAKIAN